MPPDHVVEKLGPVTISGPKAFVSLGAGVLQDVIKRHGQSILGQLLTGPTELRYVEQIGSPAPPWAKGYWRGGQRRAAVRQLRKSNGALKTNLLRYLTVHELLGHGSDEDVLAGKRRELMGLMRPKPSSWTDVDQLTGMAAYWHLPSEAYADALTMILLGLTSSPYADDYTRDVLDPETLLDIVVGAADPGDQVEPGVPTPEPPPQDLDVIRAAWRETDQAIRSQLDDYGAIIG